VTASSLTSHIGFRRRGPCFAWAASLRGLLSPSLSFSYALTQRATVSLIATLNLSVNLLLLLITSLSTPVTESNGISAQHQHGGSRRLSRPDSGDTC
jgi:hypothetical protein